MTIHPPSQNKADYTRTFLTFIAQIPTFLCALVWLIYIVRHLCKTDARYGTLKWYIQLSRLNNVKLLRRTVIFFFLAQVFVLVSCIIIAGELQDKSNCDAGGNDCLNDKAKETYGELVAKLFTNEFIFEQLLCFFVLSDLYDSIEEENALLNLDSSVVANLECSWLKWYMPNGPNEIKELMEDSALHILLFNKYNLKGDQDKGIVGLRKLLGLDGANRFAQEVLTVAGQVRRTITKSALHAGHCLAVSSNDKLKYILTQPSAIFAGLQGEAGRRGDCRRGLGRRGGRGGPWGGANYDRAICEPCCISL